MPKTRKTIDVVVTLSVPTWLSRRQAKKEVRALLNEQCFYGHRHPGTLDEVDSHNFRARKIS